MKNNPFVMPALGVWAVFFIVHSVATFKPWAYLIWVPWLGFWFIAPMVWWWKHNERRG